ncbi:MAG: (2Fe-2S)-binding protein [Vulcanimicrobiota bacterium]
MEKITLNVNGTRHDLEVEPSKPLLWVLREDLGLTGTKFGCGATLCGACTVHLDGAPTRTCLLPVSQAVGKEVTTIEGLQDHPVQQAWREIAVPQCGYCQSGQIMAAVGLLNQNASPSDDEIDSAMAGNLCRCGTYVRIRQAIRQAAGS